MRRTTRQTGDATAHARAAAHADVPTHARAAAAADAPTAAHARVPTDSRAVTRAGIPADARAAGCTHIPANAPADPAAHAHIPAHTRIPTDARAVAHVRIPAHARLPTEARSTAHARIPTRARNAGRIRGAAHAPGSYTTVPVSRTLPRALVLGLSTLLLSSCAADGAPAPAQTTAISSAPLASEPVPATPGTTTSAPGQDPFLPDWVTEGGSAALGEATTIATGLDAPWSIVRLSGGASLISERDSGRILEVLDGGALREVTTVEGVEAYGEGGLLGLAAAEGAVAQEAGAGAEGWLFVAFSGSQDNRIVRYELQSTTPGTVELGLREDVLTGVPRAANHNGGRVKIGPDGKLYFGAGDAASPQLAQDPGSLAGKILRLELDGSVPADNPFGTLVYSLGHRNPQGLTWDASGQLWASEFGQDTWDELNVIQPGGNYGWPVVEGRAGDPGYVDPVQVWSPSEASPSGLVWLRETLVLASLRGQRLWQVTLPADAVVDPGAVPDALPQAEALVVREYGRLRDVVLGPEGTIWVLTNNTDGRGSPGAGDDRLLQFAIG